MKIESAVLRRLGPVPFWRGTVKCLDELQRIYKKASEAAAAKLGVGGRSKVEGSGRTKVE